jgi:hypothetical protein
MHFLYPVNQLLVAYLAVQGERCRQWITTNARAARWTGVNHCCLDWVSVISLCPRHVNTFFRVARLATSTFPMKFLWLGFRTLTSFPRVKWTECEAENAFSGQQYMQLYLHVPMRLHDRVSTSLFLSLDVFWMNTFLWGNSLCSWNIQ